MSSNASIISRLIQPGGDLISDDETVSTGGTTTYATVADLPLSGNSAGDQAFVEGNDHLYLWTGTGWYNIALINTAPNITGGGAGSYALAIDGTPTVVTLTAEDPEGLPITWSYAVTSGTLGNNTVSQADNVFTITPSTNQDDGSIFELTFTASDGVNIATDVNSFSLTFSEEYFANTVLLLQSDDVTDGSQNNTFLDSSTNAHTITRNGNVTQGSFSPFSQDEGKWGNYFDGSGDYLTVADDASLDLGTGDFAISGWFYKTNTTNNMVLFDGRGTGSSAGYGVAVEGTSNKLFLFNGGTASISTTAITANRWHYFVFSRSGSSLTLHLNGVLEDTDTNTASFDSDGINIGQKRYTGSGFVPFVGYMSNINIVKGATMLTDLPTAPTESTVNTSLLTCQSNRFVDNSSNAHSITVSGDPEVAPFSPFAPSTAYDPATKGGSGDFQGSSDYLQMSDTDVPSTLWWQGQTTFEYWIYPREFGGTDNGTNNSDVIGWGSPTSGGEAFNFGPNSSGNLVVYYYNGSQKRYNPSGSLKLREWAHLALDNNNGSITVYLNGNNVGSFNVAGTPSPAPFLVGQMTSGGTFNGILSNIRISTTRRYTSAFTPPTSPFASDADTALLLNFTNAGIYDGTGRNVLETVGDAQVDTAVKKYGTGSMQFDGATGYLEAPASRLFDFGDGDFTIEFWMYNQSDSDDRGGIFELYVNDNNYLRFFRQTGDQLEVQVSNAGTQNVDISTSITEDQWTHVALVVNNGTMTVYKDGTSVGSDSSFTLPDLSSAQVLVGLDLLLTDRWYTGYLDDLRITKGVARYTANFTPPEAKLPNL